MPTYSFRRKKRFGQHFLNSKRFAERIVDFAGIEDQVVLEIGSGKGMLTKFISERANKVFAIEIDARLVEILRRMHLTRVHIINNDFLKLDLRRFGRPVIIGNIPYSITKAIVEKLVNERNHFKKAVLTVQKEYGQRLRASVGSHQYCTMSLFINYYFHVLKGFAIPARFFSPQPKVHSVVVSLTKKRPALKIGDEEEFFAFVEGIFRYRRKSLRNALIHHTNTIPRGIDEDLLQKRPGMLTLNDFHLLYTKLC
jgi:16S rRNA (adenine1518-N6/adenine1519-N6)-dimethyltransferase